VAIVPINYVPGEGSMDAKIVVFGQSPGKQEMEEGRPFRGPAGHVYNQILHNAKILRSSIWTDNMAKRQPDRNKIASYFQGRAPGEQGNAPIMPKPELEEWIEENRQLIVRIQPNVIVPLGNEALWMVTGLEGITKWRGSILRSWDYFVPGIKVIPSYHPSFLQRGNTHLQPLVEADLKRAKGDSEFRELNLPSPTFHIDPSLQDVIDWIHYIAESEWCSCDIETRYSQTIALGLAATIDEALCIPFTAYGKPRWTDDEEALIWKALANLLEYHYGIVGHNFIYDASILGRWHRIACRKPRIDTMVAWHECYPALPKGLNTVASVLTRHPYYKDDKKEWMGKINDVKLREYNCKDLVSTLESAIRMNSVELDGWGVRQSYEFQMDLHDIATKMAIFGANCSEGKKKELSHRYRDTLNFHQKRLDACASRHINVRSPQLKNYLYVELGLPAQFDKHTKNPTAGLPALRRLESQLKRTSPSDPRLIVIQDVMEVSKTRKLLESYSEVKLDPYDGRMRFGVSVAGTETWRMTMGKSMFGGGFSMQTAPVRTKEGRLIRTLFTADEGKRLANFDLARAEAMLVAWLANEVLMIDMFSRGEDTHWHNAKLIAQELGQTDVQMDTIYDKLNEDHYDLRYCGKECSHAIHYKMGPRQMRDSLLKYGIDLPEKTCKSIIITYKIHRPAIPQWHLRVEYDLKRKRTLETPDVNGVKKKRVFFGRIDDTMLREALAFIPQTTTGLVNHTIMLRTDQEFGHKGLDILSDGHDGFLFQFPEDWDHIEVFKKIDEFGHIPMMIGGRELVIPREFETGPNWGEMEEVKL
jgi:uracil-DNA glycosylase